MCERALCEKTSEILKRGQGLRYTDKKPVMDDLVKMFMSIALIGRVGLILRLYRALVAKPEKLRSALRKAGDKWTSANSFTW